MKQFETFLFDWDGCLADTLTAWIKAYHDVFRQFGVEVTDEQVVSIFGDRGGFKKFGVDLTASDIDGLFTQVRDSLIKVMLHAEVSEVISAIKLKGIKTAIVTTSSRKVIEPVLQRDAISGLFDLIVDGDDVVKHKPDPEPIYIALERLGSRADSAVMVGDSDKDILSGNAAGVTTVLFYPAVNQKIYKREHIDALKPDYLFSDFRQLLDLV